MEPERVGAVWGLRPYEVWSRRGWAVRVGSGISLGSSIGGRNLEPYSLN